MAQKKRAPIRILPQELTKGIGMIADDIVSKSTKLKRPLIVLLGGGGTTGKSTLSEKLISLLSEKGLTCQHVELDHYFKPEKNIPHPEDGKYDNPLNSFLDAATKNIRDLRANNDTYIPVHDRAKHAFTNFGKDGKHVSPNSNVVLCEGLYALNPELYPLGDIRIYVETPPVERVRRRYIRDKWLRGRSDEHIANMVVGRQPYHQAFVEVTRPVADYIYETPQTRGEIEVVPLKFGRLREYVAAGKEAGLDIDTRRKIIKSLERRRMEKIERIKKAHF